MENKIITTSFLKAISAAFLAYNKFGARSNKKLLPIHKWFAEIIESKLTKDYSVRSLGKGGEVDLNGKYYPKTLDITILKGKKIITTISFKFVTSNYKQNSNNYFENLLGETANIRRTGIGFAHFLVLRARTPYYDKNKGNLRGKEKKLEILHESDLLKYIKLFKDLDFPHKPEVLGIAIIDFDRRGNAYLKNLDELKLSNKTKNILQNQLSLAEFIKKVVALCKFKS
ncbi:MAG TPA: hypothetical protein P5241_00430 [Candidatus Paceibacterota bacterium]|nr:hypothetical protein [Candidatus Paceibacterota bacterium]